MSDKTMRTSKSSRISGAFLESWVEIWLPKLITSFNWCLQYEYRGNKILFFFIFSLKHNFIRKKIKTRIRPRELRNSQKSVAHF